MLAVWGLYGASSIRESTEAMDAGTEIVTTFANLGFSTAGCFVTKFFSFFVQFF